MRTTAENLLLRHLARCLGSGLPRDARVGSAQREGDLPERLELSEAFPAHYRRLLQHAVPRRLAERFGLRDFHFVVEDRTRRVRISDGAFWAALRFDFSRAGLEAVWSLLRGSGADGVPADTEELLTEWDTLLLSWVSPDGLCPEARPGDWAVAAYWLLGAGRRPDESLPLRGWFESPEAVPFPLRFLLVEHAAGCWAAARARLEARIEEARSADAVSWSRAGWPLCDPRNPGFMGWVASAAGGFGFAAVRAAIETWRGPGQEALDDVEYLDSAVQGTRLFEHGRALEATLGSVGRPGDPS